MAKLTSIKPRLGGMKHRMGQAPADDRERDKRRRDTQQSKRWLNTKWWRDTRERILIRDLYQCQMCGILVAGKRQAEIDHKRPHRENRDLFFCSDDGMQTLCHLCHVGKKQREEQSEIKGVWY